MPSALGPPCGPRLGQGPIRRGPTPEDRYERTCSQSVGLATAVVGLARLMLELIGPLDGFLFTFRVMTR